MNRRKFVKISAGTALVFGSGIASADTGLSGGNPYGSDPWDCTTTD